MKLGSLVRENILYSDFFCNVQKVLTAYVYDRIRVLAGSKWKLWSIWKFNAGQMGKISFTVRTILVRANC